MSYIAFQHMQFQMLIADVINSYNNFITHTYVTQRLKEESRTKWERQCIGQIPKHYKYTAKTDHPISVCDHKCGKRNIREHEDRRCDAASTGIGRWPWAWADVYLWDWGLRTLSGPVSAPIRLQGGVWQPQTSQLWPLAWGSSGMTYGIILNWIEFLNLETLLYVSQTCSVLCFAEVMTHEESARSAKVIFVCVHREHYEFLEKMAPQLERKVSPKLKLESKRYTFKSLNTFKLFFFSFFLWINISTFSFASWPGNNI